MFSSQPKDTATPSATLKPRSILDAAEDGRELSTAEAAHLLTLTQDDDLTRLRQVADTLRKRQTGEAVLYETGTSLFLTNLCEMAPILYPYPRKPAETGAYTLTIDDIDATLELAHARQLRTITVSGGGFWEGLSIPGLEAPNALKTCMKLLRHIQERYPTFSIRGFSPDEIEFLCILNDRSERYMLDLLMDHGLSVLMGFGSDVLVDSVRVKASPRKATVKRWLEITATARRLELPVIASIEAGPLETVAERVRHLDVLRRFLRKHPGTFSRIIPYMWTKPPSQPTATPGLPFTSHTHRLKLIAVTRLFLGEAIPNQQVCWLPDRMEEAQDALSWGANHFGSTDSLAYHHFLTGNRTSTSFNEQELKDLIAETGRESNRLG